MKKQYENPQVTLDKFEIKGNIAYQGVLSDVHVDGDDLEWEE